MFQLSQRIDLIHELGQLRTGKEFFNCRCDRPGIDKLSRHHCCNVTGTHSIFNISNHSVNSNSEFILNKLSNSSYTTIPQVIDIIRKSVNIIIKSHYFSNNLYKIFYQKNSIFLIIFSFDSQSLIETISSN